VIWQSSRAYGRTAPDSGEGVKEPGASRRDRMAGLCPGPRNSFSSLPAVRGISPPAAVSQDATCRISRGAELFRNRCPLCMSSHSANLRFALAKLADFVSTAVGLPMFAGVAKCPLPSCTLGFERLSMK